MNNQVRKVSGHVWSRNFKHLDKHEIMVGGGRMLPMTHEECVAKLTSSNICEVDDRVMYIEIQGDITHTRQFGKWVDEYIPSHSPRMIDEAFNQKILDNKIEMEHCFDIGCYDEYKKRFQDEQKWIAEYKKA